MIASSDKSRARTLRSSITRHLEIDIRGLTPAGRDVEGTVPVWLTQDESPARIDDQIRATNPVAISWLH